MTTKHLTTRFSFNAILLALLLISTIGQSQSLSEAIRIGLEKSPSVQKALAEASVSFQEIREAKSGLLPQISTESLGGAAFRDRSIDGIATGTGETLLSREARVTFQQLLFDFGATKALVNSADLRNQFRQMLIDDVRQGQALEIAVTYLDLYRYRLQAGVVRKQLSDLAEYKSRALAMEDSKTAAPAMVIGGRMVNTQAKLAVYEARIKALGGRFRLLTTLSPDGSMRLERVPRKLGDAVNIYNSPRIRAATLAIKNSEMNIKAARKDMLPKFYLEGRAGLGQNVLGIDGRDNEWSSLLAFRWTPYQGGRKQAILSKQEAELEKDKAARAGVIRTVSDAVILAQADLDGAVERRVQLRRAKAEMGKALKKYADSLDAGGEGVGVLSLVNTRTEIMNVELESYNALIDSYIASARGLEAAGGLLAYFGIGVSASK